MVVGGVRARSHRMMRHYVSVNRRLFPSLQPYDLNIYKGLLGLNIWTHGVVIIPHFINMGRRNHYFPYYSNKYGFSLTKLSIIVVLKDVLFPMFHKWKREDMTLAQQRACDVTNVRVLRSMGDQKPNLGGK